MSWTNYKGGKYQIVRRNNDWEFFCEWGSAKYSNTSNSEESAKRQARHWIDDSKGS